MLLLPYLYSLYEPRKRTKLGILVMIEIQYPSHLFSALCASAVVTAFGYINGRNTSWYCRMSAGKCRTFPEIQTNYHRVTNTNPFFPFLKPDAIHFYLFPNASAVLGPYRACFKGGKTLTSVGKTAHRSRKRS